MKFNASNELDDEDYSTVIQSSISVCKCIDNVPMHILHATRCKTGWSPVNTICDLYLDKVGFRQCNLSLCASGISW